MRDRQLFARVFWRGSWLPTSIRGTLKLLHEAGEKVLGVTLTVYADSGVEKVNGLVDPLHNSGFIQRVLAQAGVAYSNSMVEAFLALDETPDCRCTAQWLRAGQVAGGVLRRAAQHDHPARGVHGRPCAGGRLQIQAHPGSHFRQRRHERRARLCTRGFTDCRGPSSSVGSSSWTRASVRALSRPHAHCCAVIEPGAVEHILQHLGERPAPPPIASPRAPPAYEEVNRRELTSKTRKRTAALRLDPLARRGETCLYEVS